MLSVHNLHKNYGIQPILQNINFNIGAGERLGLIGPNGSGKTALMRILAGLEKPDSGIVTSTRPNLRIGYLAQGMNLPPNRRFTRPSKLPHRPWLTRQLRSNPLLQHCRKTRMTLSFKKNTTLR